MNYLPGVLMCGDDASNRELKLPKRNGTVEATVRQLSKGDEDLVGKVVSLFAEGLGSGFITTGKIEDILSRRSNLQLLGGFIGSKLVALLTVSAITDEKMEYFQVACFSNRADFDFLGQKVGMLVSLVVAKKYRRRGLGSRMMQAGIKFLNNMGCQACIGTAWESGNSDSSATVLKAAGFQCVATFENYWSDESASLGYECPTCGPPPCKCSALLYYKAIEGERV